MYTHAVTKHLVDIDDAALASAQAELGTSTMKDTVNEALRRSALRQTNRVARALTRLGELQYQRVSSFDSGRPPSAQLLSRWWRLVE
jgi:Arc/MetJ family transcription regulator